MARADDVTTGRGAAGGPVFVCDARLAR